MIFLSVLNLYSSSRILYKINKLNKKGKSKKKNQEIKCSLLPESCQYEMVTRQCKNFKDRLYVKLIFIVPFFFIPNSDTFGMKFWGLHDIFRVYFYYSLKREIVVTFQIKKIITF